MKLLNSDTMKKYTLLLLFVPFFYFLACKTEKKVETIANEDVQVEHQWTEKNMLEFERNCVGFLEADGVKNAKVYCDCLLKSSFEAYPDATIAMELEQNEIVKLFEDSECIDDLLLIKIENPWTEEVEQLFIEHCKIAQAKIGVEDTEANAYCACGLGEIKKIIPHPQHVMSLTEEELASILENCK